MMSELAYFSFPNYFTILNFVECTVPLIILISYSPPSEMTAVSFSKSLILKKVGHYGG